MKMAVQIDRAKAPGISFQEASIDIWDKKYRLKSKTGEVIDETMDDTYKRVALALAEVEPEADRERWFETFLWALRHGAIPGRPHRLQCRRPRAQAGDLHHQLHGVRHDRRFHAHHPREGARGGPDAEGRLRHRL